MIRRNRGQVEACIMEDADGQFHVQFRTGNNEPWYTSEGYTREADARRSAQDFVKAIRSGGFVLR